MGSTCAPAQPTRRRRERRPDACRSETCSRRATDSSNDRGHYLLDTFAPFHALVRLKGLEIACDRRHGVGGGACADQRNPGDENFAGSHKRIFGLKAHFKSSKLMTMTIGQVA